jgi:hypothetical protein
MTTDAPASLLAASSFPPVGGAPSVAFVAPGVATSGAPLPSEPAPHAAASNPEALSVCDVSRPSRLPTSVSGRVAGLAALYMQQQREQGRSSCSNGTQATTPRGARIGACMPRHRRANSLACSPTQNSTTGVGGSPVPFTAPHPVRDEHADDDHGPPGHVSSILAGSVQYVPTCSDRLRAAMLCQT